MTMQATLSGRELGQVATNRGWGDFQNWALSLPAKFGQVRRLAEEGEAAASALRDQLLRAVKDHPTPLGVDSVVEGMLGLLPRGSSSGVFVVGDGVGDGDDDLMDNAECRPGQTRKQTQCEPRNPKAGYQGPRVLGETTCKECSAVAIKAITGTAAKDVKRTLPETVFEIEDRGFVRDVSPTKAWRGKTVDEFANGANYPLALVHVSETSEHEAHVMPMVGGKLGNRAGWHEEPIATVVAFTPKPHEAATAKAPLTGTPDYPKLLKTPGGAHEMPSRDSPGVRQVTPQEVESFAAGSGSDVPVPIHRVAKSLGWDPHRTGHVLRRAMADGKVSGRVAEMLTGDPDEMAYTYKNQEGELIGRVVRRATTNSEDVLGYGGDD